MSEWESKEQDELLATRRDESSAAAIFNRFKLPCLSDITMLFAELGQSRPNIISCQASNYF